MDNDFPPRVVARHAAFAQAVDLLTTLVLDEAREDGYEPTEAELEQRYSEEWGGLMDDVSDAILAEARKRLAATA